MSISVNESQLPAVLDTLREKLDNAIGSSVFVSIMQEMLKNCNVTGWKQNGDDYHLTLKHSIKAVHPESGRKIFYLEKELVLRFIPSKLTIFFPRVRDLHGRIKNNELSALDGTDKKLGTIWAEQEVSLLFTTQTYTAAVYSMRWDAKEKKVKVISIDDSWAHEGKLQTETLTLEQQVKRWTSRNFETTKL